MYWSSIPLSLGLCVYKRFCGPAGIQLGHAHCGHRWIPQNCPSNKADPAKFNDCVWSLMAKKWRQKEKLRSNHVYGWPPGGRSQPQAGRRPPEGGLTILFVSLLLAGHTQTTTICTETHTRAGSWSVKLPARVSCGWSKLPTRLEVLFSTSLSSIFLSSVVPIITLSAFFLYSPSSTATLLCLLHSYSSIWLPTFHFLVLSPSQSFPLISSSFSFFFLSHFPPPSLTSSSPQKAYPSCYCY